MVRAWGSCLTLFTVPILYDREPWGTTEVRREFEARMAAFVREHPHVAFIDFDRRSSSSYGLRQFGDGDHLTASGATRFSRELSDALARRYGDRECGS
jgi:hypothetical protein